MTNPRRNNNPTRPVTGERHHNAKLTSAKAAYIRASRAPGPDLARELKVSRSCIWYVRQGLTWKTEQSKTD